MQPILGPTWHLDRLSDQRSDRDHMDALMDAETSRYFVLAGGKPVVDSSEDRSEANLRWFTRTDLDTMGVPMMEVLFLGLQPDDGHALFAVSVTEHFARHAPEAEGRLLPPVDLRSLAAQGSLSEQELGIAAQAVALHNWHEENRCCGRCGGSMSPRNGGWKRRCWACKNEVFPRMDPVVIMAVRHGDKILLAHEERFPESMFSTIAGYVEPGDDIINAVRRETMEEVGLRVGEVIYHGSQPWPFPHSLMIGCVAMAESDEIRINPEEVSDARWFDREEVAQMVDRKHPQGLWVPGPQSMAHSLITRYLKETG